MRQEKKIIFWLLAPPHILRLSGDVQRDPSERNDCTALCIPTLLKPPRPSDPNFATVQSKVMKLRYSLEDSSVSHPQPNLHYSTVGLPLHPRGCLLSACEAQWTEFQ